MWCKTLWRMLKGAKIIELVYAINKLTLLKIDDSKCWQKRKKKIIRMKSTRKHFSIQTVKNISFFCCHWHWYPTSSFFVKTKPKTFFSAHIHIADISSSYCYRYRLSIIFDWSKSRYCEFIAWHGRSIKNASSVTSNFFLFLNCCQTSHLCVVDHKQRRTRKNKIVRRTLVAKYIEWKARVKILFKRNGWWERGNERQMKWKEKKRNEEKKIE